MKMNGCLADVDLQYVVSLYKRYAADLKRVREFERRFYRMKSYPRWERFFLYRALRYIVKTVLALDRPARMRPQLDDIEAEITYLLIRDRKPVNVVEISPCGGWSTSWILNALKDNGSGRLYSFDLVDDATRIVSPTLSEGRWIFVKGDVRENVLLLPPRIESLFIDSDHSAEFAQWYIDTIFSMLEQGTVVSVHDVFHTTDPAGFDTEGEVIMRSVEGQCMQYFTASRAKNEEAFRRIKEVKNSLGISTLIHSSEANSMIFFTWTRRQEGK